MVNLSPQNRSTFTKYITKELEDFGSAKLRMKIIIFILLSGGVWISYNEVLRIPSLKDKITKLEKETQIKTEEIQRLETSLIPFKTLALEKYAGSENEVLKKLADKIKELEQLDALKNEKISSLGVEVQQAKENVQPNQLIFASKEILKNNNEYIVTLKFRASKNEQIGQVILIVKIPRFSKEHIIDFWPTQGQIFVSGEESKQISEDRHSARLAYQPLYSPSILVDLKVSGPISYVSLRGNLGIEPFIVNLE